LEGRPGLTAFLTGAVTVHIPHANPRRPVHTLTRTQRVEGTPDDVFGFFADATDLEAITPPWLRFRVVSIQPIEMRQGTLIEYRLVLHRFPIRWLTRIDEWGAGVRFVDSQLHGPYKLWHHTHAFEADGEAHTVVRDTVRYALPFGPLGSLAHALFVKCPAPNRHSASGSNASVVSAGNLLLPRQHERSPPRAEDVVVRTARFGARMPLQLHDDRLPGGQRPRHAR
jgi:ligand-binding SRPBCC domain-containing protein